MCLFPWLDVGLQILIHAHYGHSEGYVHADRHRVRPVECTYSLIFYYLFYALSGRQMRAQLKSLFDHVTRCDEEVMRECGHGSDHGRVQDLELLIFIVEVAFEQLIHREVGGVRRYAPAGNDLSTLPKTQEPLFLIEYFPCPEES